MMIRKGVFNVESGSKRRGGTGKKDRDVEFLLDAPERDSEPV